MCDLAKQCAELISQVNAIAVLTGAGISTNAGIPDFRGPKGLYVTKKYDADQVFDINSFHYDPNPFYEFARDFISLEAEIQPTFTHRFLSQLEQDQKLIGVITQNIDSLHQQAGSKKVFEVHGSFWQSFCLLCERKFDYDQMKTFLADPGIPKCDCGGTIKPDIVFFGEGVKHFHEATQVAADADLFFVIGTSCVVQPAGSIPQYANSDVVIVNKGEVSLNVPNLALTVDEDIDNFFKKVAELC